MHVDYHVALTLEVLQQLYSDVHALCISIVCGIMKHVLNNIFSSLVVFDLSRSSTYFWIIS